MFDIRTARAEDCAKLVPLLSERGYPTAEADLAARLDTILNRDEFRRSSSL
ncbi:hypothetical protein [Rhizobium yanglingense]